MHPRTDLLYCTSPRHRGIHMTSCLTIHYGALRLRTIIGLSGPPSAALPLRTIVGLFMTAVHMRVLVSLLSLHDALTVISLSSSRKVASMTSAVFAMADDAVKVLSLSTYFPDCM